MTKYLAPRRARAAAIAVLIAVAAAACAPASTSVSSDREIAADSTDQTAGRHQYGATLDEWTEAERAAAGVEGAGSTVNGDSEYTLIEWQDLIPEGESGADIMSRFEEQLAQVERGSDQATALYQEMSDSFDPAAVNVDLSDQKIRLAGFVAPLTFENELVIEFLLVPTLGACVHVPPPPANQTVMVTLDPADGMTIEETFGAIWVEGTLVIEESTTDLAPASYMIVDATSTVYESL